MCGACVVDAVAILLQAAEVARGGAWLGEPERASVGLTIEEGGRRRSLSLNYAAPTLSLMLLH